jgi:hypothetical protein
MAFEQPGSGRFGQEGPRARQRLNRLTRQPDRQCVALPQQARLNKPKRDTARRRPAPPKLSSSSTSWHRRGCTCNSRGHSRTPGTSRRLPALRTRVG